MSAAIRNRATSTRRWSLPSGITPIALASPSTRSIACHGSTLPAPMRARSCSTNASHVRNTLIGSASIEATSQIGSGHTRNMAWPSLEGRNPMNILLEEKPTSATSSKSTELTQLIRQYGCGPVEFTGTEDALYERHLVFDNVLEAAEIGGRERFEAVARSVRDILSQRWIRTEETYDRNDPKRVYYLSMEFLIGRSLANNVTNLLLDDATKKVLNEQKVDWYDGNSGHGLWPPLSIWYVQANHSGRLATRSSRQLAASFRSLGGPSSKR